MSDLEDKRNLAEKAKEKIHRKRVMSRYVERAATVTMSEDGKATWTRAEPGEYYIARMGFFGYKDRKPCGTNSPYNDEQSKSSAKMFDVVKGFEPEKLDKESEHNKRKMRDVSFNKAGEKEIS